MAHRLILPLPSTFSTPDGDVEGYSVFAYDDCSTNVQHPQLLAYIDRLTSFLHKTRLIQYHPEDFFRFFLFNGDSRKTGESANVLLHLDGSPVREEEILYMRDLCETFAAMGKSDEALIEELNVLICNGPPAGSAESLQSFFAETKALQMNRRRRPQNDVASLVLRTEHDRAPLSSTTTTLSSSLLLSPKHTDELNVAKECRRKRIMDMVLGHGMGPKKQHEVSIMRDTVIGLIDSCNTASNKSTLFPLEPVETVMNIGEGKGYVSRALALCDGLQVIGLDCNLLHKERVVERVEYLLQGRLGVDATQKEMKGRDILNFMYEPRGHIATISCHVGPNMEWANVLRGHVRLSGLISSDNSVCPINPGALLEKKEDKEVVSGGMDFVDISRKLQCRICSYIVRRGAVAAIVRHTRYHVYSGHTTTISGMPSKQTMDEWNRSLPVEAFTERVIATFFTNKVLHTSNVCADSNLSSELEGIVGKEAFLSVDSARDNLQDIMNAFNLLANTQLLRGTRVEVLMPVKQEEEEEEEECKGSALDTVVYKYINTCLTILGYDCAPNHHFVIRDDGRCKEAFTLLTFRDESQFLEGFSIDKLHLPPAEDAWCLKLAVLLRILPPVSPHTPVVHIPDLCNVVMMGLHSCGDLGSNVCRLFTESASRGLLLVSCCWHALSSDGFPLSRELQRRGWRTDQLSLLLATQPLDMWATVSAKGHRSAACVLFYRSLLKIFWDRLRDLWCSSISTSTGSSMTCCQFVEVPHLEPAFLRRISKIKDTITLETLYVEVCREYFFAETAKQPSCKRKEHICSSCLEAQISFLASETNVSLAAEVGCKYFNEHFGSFFGLTVLRMWMCHLVETLLLLDRTLYLAESLREDMRCCGSVVSLVPLFDGAVSPRMYGILARRIPR